MKFILKRTKLVLITLLTVYGLLIVILSLSSESARAFIGGPPPGHTGAPGEPTCTDCHSPNVLTGQFHIILPVGYVPGQSYTIQVQHATSDPSVAAWGFELTSLTPTNAAAGTFANTSAFTRIRTGGGRNYIEQTAAGAFPGQTGGATWMFSWTAPPTDVGPITFYAAGLQANNSGDEDGDETYTSSEVVPVGGATPTPTPTNTPSGTPTPTATSTPTITPTPTPRPATLGNISTRLQVGTSDRVMIAGFIVQGTVPKRVLIRAAGPSLTQFGVPNALANPRVELHDTTGTIGMNDDWQITQIGGVITSDQVAEIQSSGLAPSDPAESALIATLSPGTYTAIVEGVNNGTGVGIVEVYDLAAGSASLLANISTRGFVQTGDDAMIGGFIVVTQPTRVIIRAIGPSLTQFGVPDALANPQLELHDASGTIAQNNDWQTTQIGGIITMDQVAEIQNSLLAPTNSAESAIIGTLQPGSYTAIVRGVNNTTGNGLVEVYSLP